MTAYLYLAEIEVYDLDTKTVTTLRYASGQGHVTTPSETPASTLYDARIAQAVNIPRHLFADGKLSGRSRVSYGDLVLQNADGALDGLLAYAMAGRPVTIRRGVPGAAYPSGFTTLFVGTVEQAEAQGDTLLIKMRDKQADLLVPLQTNQYGGTNVLPDGLDGVPDDLAGKRKPLCFGQVFNAPIPSVNTARLIYQVSDGLVNSVDAVYDAGVPLLAGFPMTVRDAGYGAGTTVTACAYGADLFVAVTDTGGLVTSPDGVTWTARTSGFGSSVIYDVIFANGMFVTCGQGGKVATSMDGVTWTLQSTVLSGATLRKLAFGKGYWLVIGTTGQVASSPDAVTWTTGDTGFAGQNSFSLTFGNGRFVIGGAEGRYASSIDGLTWTDSAVQRPQIPGFETVAVYTLAYGGGLFVAGGQNGALATSPDGVYWTDRSGVFDSPVESVTVAYYGTIASGTGNIFIIAGTSGSVATSEDGITWTKVTSGVGVTSINGLAFGDGRFIAVGVNGLVASSGAGQTYATIVDLMDDTQAPVAGTYGAYYGTSGSYVRLGASPYGQITADITQGASAAARTAGQLFAAVLGHAGKVSGDWSSSDVTALDTATGSAVCGDWIYGDDTIADVLDRIAASAGAWWGPDRTGVYRIQQLTAPAGTAAYTITANDAQQPLARLAITDDTKGLPPWRSIVQYKRNFAVQPGAGGGGSGLTNSAIVAGSTGQDLQTNTAVLASGSTTPRQLADRFGEMPNVMDYSATGDGSTDDTAAIQAAITDAVARQRGTVLLPSGQYRVTSTITIPSGIILRGEGSPASLSGSDQTFTAILHDFDGDCLAFDGSTGTGAGYGCGVRDLAIYQQYGSSGGATVGSALTFVTTDDSIRPLWVRLENVNIEQLSTAAPWEWGVVLDGTANSNLLRDCWISNTRIAIGGGGSGAVNCLGVANLWMVATECNLSDANVVVSGDSTHKSTNINLLGCSVAGTLSIDYGQNVFVDGGSYAAITVSANAGGSGVPVVLKPGQVTSAVTNNAGSNCLVMRYDVSTGLLLDKKIRCDGTLGVQSAPITSAGLILDSTASFTGSTSAFGVKSDGTMASDVTTTGAALYARLRTAAASFTLASGIGLTVQDAVKGSGSTITTQYGIKVENQTQGGTNYAIYTGTGTVHFGALTEAPRFKGTGTAHVAGDYAASANWGTSPTISPSARDSGGRVSVTAAATTGANPTLTLTFKDGTWTTAPAVVCSRGDTDAAAGDWRVTSVSATAVVFTFVGTPTAGSTYILDFLVVGK